MSNLKLQKRLAASIMRVGRHKVWLDPNEVNEIGMANTRMATRKLIRDGFIIKKPRKIHSRFRARIRKIEKSKGRHLGHGSRKGTRNARNPVKKLWIKRQRAMRRLLVRYKLKGKIDKKMYHRYYLKAKGNAFKNKANLIERINGELSEKTRNQQLLEQYKVRREEALARKMDKERRKQKFLDAQLKMAEEAEQIRLQQEAAEAQAKAAKAAQAQKGKKSRGRKGKSMDVDEPTKGKGKGKGKKGAKGKKGKETEAAAEEPKKKRVRKRGKKGGNQ